jgi:tRNA-dihydrouridine synthase A
LFIVHARNAVLKGLSPKENREIPPLRYEVVRRLKQDFPALTIVLNGGLSDFDAIGRELPYVDGVMLGRVAYHDPYLLAQADWNLFGDETPARSRAEVLRAMIPYARAHVAQGTPLRAIVRHMLGLYHGQSRGRLYRRLLSDADRLRDADVGLLEEALSAVEPSATEAAPA